MVEYSLEDINKLVEIDNTIYWCQGYKEESEISMYREVKDLFDIELEYLEHQYDQL